MSNVFSIDDGFPCDQIGEVLVFGIIADDIGCSDADWQIGYFCKRSGWMIKNNGDYIDGGYGEDYRALISHWTAKPERPQ